MENRIKELEKEHKKIKEKLEQDIIKRKTFKKLLPLLRKLNFENIAYTYKDKELIQIRDGLLCNEILAFNNIPIVFDNPDYTKDFYIIYDKAVIPKYNKYKLYMDDFIIRITDNIKDIELILKGIIGVRMLNNKGDKL